MKGVGGMTTKKKDTPYKEYCKECGEQVHEFEPDHKGTVHEWIDGKLITHHADHYLEDINKKGK